MHFHWPKIAYAPVGGLAVYLHVYVNPNPKPRDVDLLIRQEDADKIKDVLASA